ncbi:hypothetical protein QYM36_011351 [Artemia franciscana]|uniref:RNA helicase n=1 Tax=Artemia franciscana TaxID=6661 RepID=A0AA88HIH2_ARTSF|nr:hypothetical protein QYM36_011351 [Artemia franciscana]
MAEEAIKDMQFHKMGLDDRILKAIAKVGWVKPTLIQERAIPLALEGKDLIARGRTGSGKTAIFLIPAIQKILNHKDKLKEQSTRVIILAPTKELCRQIYQNCIQLTSSCSKDVKCTNLSWGSNLSVQKPMLMAVCPDIVISTPSRILAHLKARHLSLKTSLDLLIIDEADLVLSFGFNKDLKELGSYLPPVYQSILTSATLTADLSELKSLVLNNPSVLKLEEPSLPPASQLDQFIIYAEEEDKAVLIYTLFKLNIIRGKTLIFVRNVDRCYKLKIYLDLFGIKACTLNSELPTSSRCHIVSQFNEGLYDIIIASDERTVEDATHRQDLKESNPDKSKRKKDKESGVARGIDFQFVSNVINFDFPKSVDSYIHRVGRTARGNRKGSALSFISVAEKPLMEECEAHLQQIASEDEPSVFRPFQFKMDEVDAFRYRVRDAWKSVTSIAVRETRLAEIKAELLKSQQLKVSK